MMKYRFMNAKTGEVVTNIFQVIRAIYLDLRFNNKWLYSRKGF